MSETEDEARYYAAVERRRAMPVSEVALDEVGFAIGQVSLVWMTGDITDNKMRWVIWDRNLDGEHESGHVWIGPLVNIETDHLDKPPHEAYWPLRRARAAAAVRAVRELL